MRISKGHVQKSSLSHGTFGYETTTGNAGIVMDDNGDDTVRQATNHGSYLDTGRLLSKLALLATVTTAGLSVAMGAAGASESSAPTLAAYPPAQQCALQGQPSSVVAGATIVLTGGGATGGSTVTAVLQPDGAVIGSASANDAGGYSVSATLPASVSGSHTVTVNNETCATVLTVTLPSTPPASTPAPSTPVPSTPTGSSPAVGVVAATPSFEASPLAVRRSTAAASGARSSAASNTVVAADAIAVSASSTPSDGLAAKSNGSPLAFTGASVLIPGVLGLGLVGGGAVFMWAGRRARHRRA